MTSWIQLKDLSFPVVEFDYSVEKAFSYRKYFPHDRMLFHFCINCLNEIVNSIPLSFYLICKKDSFSV